MSRTEVGKWIQQLKAKWLVLSLIYVITVSIGLSLILTSLGMRFFDWSSWVGILFFSSVAGLMLWRKPIWYITTHHIARHLDAKFPLLEESTTLFLKPAAELSLLEQLQTDKISKYFPPTHSLRPAISKLGIGFFILLFGVGFSLLISKWPGLLNETLARSNNALPHKEIVPAQLLYYKVTITPPAYTGNQPRSQQQFLLKVEKDAQVAWQMETNVGLKQLKIIFNDKEVNKLVPLNAAATKWGFTKMIHQSGFYHLELDGRKSDLYQIEVIPDQPVKIKIGQPKQRTTIDVGQPAKVSLQAVLTDDYGITDAFIMATMASGKGEGVSFTEKKLVFNTNFSGQREVRVSKLIDLRALGMKPGDELYFFLAAKDNNGQDSRSDVYYVNMVDTAELMSMAGMTNGVNLVPEYFRSQRQIIIDTEKLLKDQAALSIEEFKSRSNTLGIDQKLLRLRYGKFLGEEAETEIGGDHDHDEHGGGEHHGAEETKFGDVQALMDQYAHKHDVAEDATFFEPELKAQLKAVLTEMWSSELRLRTYKPQEALPFEYKALRLLKDLQQKSRAYVAKTTVKTAVLKPEKRLSGELDKILMPKRSADFTPKEDTADGLRLLLAVLESRKAGKAFGMGERQLLREGEKHLIAAAAGRPGTYLPALRSLRKISTANKIDVLDIAQVQQAIQELLGLIPSTPQRQHADVAPDLYEAYFNYLKANK